MSTSETGGGNVTSKKSPCEKAWRCPSGYPKGSWGCRNFHLAERSVRLSEQPRHAEGNPR